MTLDQVVLHLIAGEVLHIAGGDEFSLPLNDSRAILACQSAFKFDPVLEWAPRGGRDQATGLTVCRVC
jgi:hypothetical protein